MMKDKVKFDIVNADKSGQLHKAENLQVTLIKKRRDYYWSYNDSDEWEMDYSEKQYPVFKKSISIIKDEKFRNILVINKIKKFPKKEGFFKIM